MSGAPAEALAAELRAHIQDIPDFPKPGIVFKDLMPLVADPVYFRATIDELTELARPLQPDVILGAEARGFIFGGALAYQLGCGFVPARKPGKLPWQTVTATYELEYGLDSLEVHADAIGDGARVIVHDDVLEETRADPGLVKELEDYGVIKGQIRAGVKYFDETEREIIRAVTELARYGVGGRNLRVFRTSADREAQLLQTILAPALRSRNPERRKEAIEALENLAAVATHLKHLLLVRDLRKVVG